MRRGGSRCATRWRGTRTRSTPTAARRRSRASPRPATAASSSTAVEGWTEHVDLDADTGRAARAPRALRPRARRALGPLRPDDGGRARLRHQGRASGAPNYGLPVMNTAIGGHASQERERVRLPRQHRGARRTRPRTPASTSRSRSTATSWPRGARTLPLLERIGHPRIKVAYDTGNCEFYGDVKAVDDLAAHRPVPRQRAPQGPPRRQGRLGLPGARATARSTSAAVLGILEAGGYTRPALGRDRVPGRAVAAARRGQRRR